MVGLKTLIIRSRVRRGLKQFGGIMDKKNLAKFALTALVVASADPVGAELNAASKGIFLAAACGGHGCNGGGKTAYNPSSSSPYNARSNQYQTQPFNQQDTGTYYTNPNTSNYNQQTRGYTTTPSSSYNDSYSYRTYTADTTPATFSETDLSSFRNQLTSEDSKRIWDDLDTQGKQLAINLSNQGRSKDLAVREAAQRSGNMNMRQTRTNDFNR